MPMFCHTPPREVFPVAVPVTGAHGIRHRMRRSWTALRDVGGPWTGAPGAQRPVEEIVAAWCGHGCPGSTLVPVLPSMGSELRQNKSNRSHILCETGGQRRALIMGLYTNYELVRHARQCADCRQNQPV
jgi:hypothetical protein